MKIYIAILLFLFLSCNKKEVSLGNRAQDSIIVSEEKSPISKANSASVVLENYTKLNTDSLSTGEIIRFVDATQLPFVLTETFTDKQQKLIIRIFNYPPYQLKGKITTEVENFNIRFNQIKLPNGDFDGPFGKEMSYKISEKGEVWLIIGKNNMADGAITGEFSVLVN